MCTVAGKPPLPLPALHTPCATRLLSQRLALLFLGDVGWKGFPHRVHKVKISPVAPLSHVYHTPLQSLVAPQQPFSTPRSVLGQAPCGWCRTWPSVWCAEPSCPWCCQSPTAPCAWHVAKTWHHRTSHAVRDLTRSLDQCSAQHRVSCWFRSGLYPAGPPHLPDSLLSNTPQLLHSSLFPHRESFRHIYPDCFSQSPVTFPESSPQQKYFPFIYHFFYYLPFSLGSEAGEECTSHPDHAAVVTVGQAGE